MSQSSEGKLPGDLAELFKIRLLRRRVLQMALGAVVILAGLAVFAGQCGGGAAEPTAAPIATSAPATVPTATTAPATAVTATSAPAATSTPPPASGETPTSSSDFSLDVCSLLTKQEVEAAIGMAVLEPRPEVVDTFFSCGYQDPDDPDHGLVSVSTIVGADREEAEFSYEVGKKNNASISQTVDGVGEDAYWLEVFGDLNILKGNYDITIGVASEAGEDRISIAKDLAEKVLSRLP